MLNCFQRIAPSEFFDGAWQVGSGEGNLFNGMGKIEKINHNTTTAITNMTI